MQSDYGVAKLGFAELCVVVFCLVGVLLFVCCFVLFLNLITQSLVLVKVIS